MAFLPGDILSCYSASYDEARRAFLRAAEAQDAAVTSHLNHCGQGVSGEDLCMDIATVGNADADCAMIVSSATHGIEGYAGSALQTGLLRDGIVESLPNYSACHLVHAVNPFGFSHYRRVNEDNVDVNRNFIDFSRPVADSDDFLGFRAFAAREMEEGRAADEAEVAARYLAAEGEQRYQRALTLGQYKDPTAIHFGGHAPTWSNRTWRGFLDDVVPGRALIIHLDIHTGLGCFGRETLIYTRDPGARGYELARRCYGEDELLIPGGALTPDVSGPIPSSFAKFEDDAVVIGVAPEFGTVPLNQMLTTLIEENALWHSECRGESERKASVARMMHCFCPDDAGWRIGAWRRFRRRIAQTIEFLNDL